MKISVMTFEMDIICYVYLFVISVVLGKITTRITSSITFIFYIYEH